MKPVCVISCPIDTFSGYGHRSRDFVRGLINSSKGDEWDIKILPQKWGSTPWGFLKPSDPLKEKFIPQLTQQPDVWIQITVPNEFQRVGKYNIGVTAGIESTIAPPDFLEGSNRMDKVLVSSNFTKKIFESTSLQVQNQQGQTKHVKLNKPVEVLFEGYDENVYFKDPQTSPLLEGIDESFCFLYTGHWLPGNLGEDRKNVGLMIKTFLETFSNNLPNKPMPALILKTNKVDYSLLDLEEVKKQIHKIKSSVPSNHPNIYVLHGEYTNEELNAINNDPKVKCFISFTKGEGFGRPLLEQAITGKPIITTNWSGHIDFIRPEYNVLIGGELRNIEPSAANQFLLKEAQWFNINVDDASKSMKDIYKHYKKYIERSRKQTKFLKENYSMVAMTNLISTLLEDVKVAVEVPLQLPKLNLPKLKKING